MERVFRNGKIFAIVMGALSLEVLVVFLILKLDGKTLGNLSFISLIMIPISVIGFCLLLWTSFHYLALGATDSARVSTINPNELLKEVSVEKIEEYHEAQAFRDVLLLLLYIVFAFFGLAIYMTPCNGCNTPYPLLAMGVVVTYGIRALVKTYHLPYFYYRYNLLAREVYNYQLYLDERRLQEDTTKDVHLTSDWSLAYLIDFFFLHVLCNPSPSWHSMGGQQQLCCSLYSTIPLLQIFVRWHVCFRELLWT